MSNINHGPLVPGATITSSALGWPFTTSTIDPNTTIDSLIVSNLSSVDGVAITGHSSSGPSLVERVNTLEKLMGVTQTRPDVEARWPELKALGDQYRALLAEMLDKDMVWGTLKG